MQINRILTPPTIATSITAHTPTSPPAVETDTRSHGAKVKLPKLSLTCFNGDLVKWPTFWDSYKSAIHNNDELAEVDNFNYLRSLLECRALDAISGLTLSAANYKEVVEILQKKVRQ